MANFHLKAQAAGTAAVRRPRHNLLSVKKRSVIPKVMGNWSGDQVLSEQPLSDCPIGFLQIILAPHSAAISVSQRRP